ncbi:DUF3011 domain-containing protein [Dokdonella sp.]|uniref:DUF3011 domain-containing protein n=1 Tax=Dokdonella sp. TaxID=2291710 RepID=UPI003C3F2156
MKSPIAASLCAVAMVLAAGWSPAARADYTITCESKSNRHNSCRLNQPGYVTLSKKLSGSTCRQGRDWDFDRREIWVDDGCRAEFKVHTKGSGKNNSSDNNKAATTAGIIVGAALLGALISNSKNKDDARYSDENYYGGQHTSYVPRWMVGTFEGYNSMYGVSVELNITPDGQVLVASEGNTFEGWINDGRLHTGDSVFNMDQVNNGFITSQVGDRANEVRYRRIR